MKNTFDGLLRKQFNENMFAAWQKKNVSIKTKGVKIRVKLNGLVLNCVNTVGNHLSVFMLKLYT